MMSKILYSLTKSTDSEIKGENKDEVKHYDNNYEYSLYPIIEGIGTTSVGSNTLGGGNSFRHGGLSNSNNNTNNNNNNGNKQNKKRDNKLSPVEIIEMEQEDDNLDDRNVKNLTPKTPTNKIKIAYPLYGEPMSFMNSVNKMDGLTFRAWEHINKYLNKSGTLYEIEYVIIKNPNVYDLVEGLKTRKYDIVLGDYGTNPDFMKDVNYTAPFMSIKDVGVYETSNVSNQFRYNTLKNFSLMIYKPLIVIIILIIMFSFAVWFTTSNTKLAGSFVQMMNGILGDRGSLLEGSSFNLNPGKNITSFIFSMVLLLSTFTFLFYLQSAIVSQSVNIISSNKDPFAHPEGTKILVPQGSTAKQTLQDCCGIITVEAKSGTTDVETIANEFMLRAKDENISGFYHSGPEVSKWIENNPTFSVSATKMSSPTPVAFMVSKYKPELLYAINKSIAEINWDGVLNTSCKEYINRLCFSV